MADPGPTPPPAARPVAPAAPRASRGALLDLAVGAVEDDRRYEDRALGGAAPAASWRHVDLAGSRVVSAALPGSELTACSWTDVVVDTCDLQGVLADRLRLLRVRLTGCRLSGATLTGADLRDTVFEDVRAPDVAVRASQLRRVAFTGGVPARLDLTHLDLADSELSEVSFTRCDLTGARFRGARMHSVAFVDCDLSGVSGVDGLAGARVDEATLLSAAASLARGLGIEVASDRS